MHIFCLCWTIFLHSITLLSFLLSSSSFEAIQKKHFSCRVITHTLRTPRHAACKAVAKAQWQFCYCYYFRKVAREVHRVWKSIKKSRFYNIVGEANYVYLQSFKVSCKSTGVILTGFGAKFKHFQTPCFVGEHLGIRVVTSSESLKNMLEKATLNFKGAFVLKAKHGREVVGGSPWVDCSFNFWL